MIYTHNDILSSYNENKIFDRPIWACNYEFDIVQFGKEYQCKPICGELKKGSFGYGDIKFIPYSKSGKLNKKSAIYYNVYEYADTEEECVNIFNSILDEKIRWCKDTIEKLNSIKIIK